MHLKVIFQKRPGKHKRIIGIAKWLLTPSRCVFSKCFPDTIWKHYLKIAILWVAVASQNDLKIKIWFSLKWPEFRELRIEKSKTLFFAICVKYFVLLGSLVAGSTLFSIVCQILATLAAQVVTQFYLQV